MSVLQSTSDLGSGRRAIRELSEIMATATRADIIVAWAMACAIGLLVLILG